MSFEEEQATTTATAEAKEYATAQRNAEETDRVQGVSGVTLVALLFSKTMRMGWSRLSKVMVLLAKSLLEGVITWPRDIMA